MTRIQILEDQKAIFVAQQEELENKRSEIYVREEQAVRDILLPFFYEFPKDVQVEVTRGSVYFKMDHPEHSYKKELFNLYLREYYDFENSKKSFSGVDLSYYTTSTKGVDEWELKRLQLLGKLAEIVNEFQQKMIYVVNEAVLPFKEEFSRISDQMNLINPAIREIESKISAFKKERILFDLQNGGVTFNKGVHIQMKFNYTPHIASIKLIDISKSGKKATAIFEWNHGGASREENVNVESITNQVLGLSKNIVSTLELV